MFEQTKCFNVIFDQMFDVHQMLSVTIQHIQTRWLNWKMYGHRTRFRSCAFMVASATKNFGLVTRISPLVASRWLTISGHNNYKTITLIFSQINPDKIQSRLPIGHLLLPFCCFWRMKPIVLLLQIYHNVSQPQSVRTYWGLCLSRSSFN